MSAKSRHEQFVLISFNRVWAHLITYIRSVKFLAGTFIGQSASVMLLSFIHRTACFCRLFTELSVSAIYSWNCMLLSFIHKTECFCRLFVELSPVAFNADRQGSYFSFPRFVVIVTFLFPIKAGKYYLKQMCPLFTLTSINQC